MSKKTKRLQIVIAALIALAVIPMSASAVQAVNWDCTTTANTDGVGYDSPSDTVPYSFTTARNPALSTNGYGDAPDTNPVFYGGVAWTDGGAGTGGGINDVPYHALDDGSWRIRLGAAIGDKAGALFLWKKADFLNGQDAETVELDSTSSFSTATDKFGAGFTNETIRFVFEDAGTSMYISESVFLADGGVVTSLSDPAATTWYDYDPAIDMMAIGGVASPNFSDVTAAGVYLEIEAETEGNKTFALNGFQLESIVAGSGSDLAVTVNLQETDDLVNGTWTNTGHTVEWGVSPDLTNKFYRAILSL